MNSFEHKNYIIKEIKLCDKYLDPEFSDREFEWLKKEHKRVNSNEHGWATKTKDEWLIEIQKTKNYWLNQLNK